MHKGNKQNGEVVTELRVEASRECGKGAGAGWRGRKSNLGMENKK